MRPVLLTLLLAACGGHRIQRLEQRPGPVSGSLEAGVPFEPTQAAFTRFGNELERMDALVDLATLEVSDRGQCISLTVRTARGLDEPLSSRGVECGADGHEMTAVRFVSESEPIVREVARTHGPGARLTLAIGGDESVLRIVERTAVVCCPVVGHRNLGLSLRKKRWSDPGEFVKLDFAWVLGRPQSTSL